MNSAPGAVTWGRRPNRCGLQQTLLSHRTAGTRQHVSGARGPGFNSRRPDQSIPSTSFYCHTLSHRPVRGACRPCEKCERIRSTWPRLAPLADSTRPAALASTVVIRFFAVDLVVPVQEAALNAVRRVVPEREVFLEMQMAHLIAERSIRSRIRKPAEIDSSQAEVQRQRCGADGALGLRQQRLIRQQGGLGIQHEIDHAPPGFKLQPLVV